MDIIAKKFLRNWGLSAIRQRQQSSWIDEGNTIPFIARYRKERRPAH